MKTVQLVYSLAQGKVIPQCLCETEGDAVQAASYINNKILKLDEIPDKINKEWYNELTDNYPEILIKGDFNKCLRNNPNITRDILSSAIAYYQGKYSEYLGTFKQPINYFSKLDNIKDVQNI